MQQRSMAPSLSSSGAGAALEQVQNELQRASDNPSKVAALLAALARLQEARQGTVQYILPTGRGSGAAALEADHAALQWLAAQMFELAQEHGIEDEYKAAMENRHRQRLAQQWGSGIDGAPLSALSCANVNIATQHVCSSEVKHVCSNCRLVAYCSPQCQRQHWGTHRADCQNKLADPGWVPRWVEERRRPTYINAGPGSSFAERLSYNSKPKQHLWGNTPAFSLVPPAANASTSEGGADSAAAGGGSTPDGGGQLPPLTQPEAHICFAASGDLRNVIMTINRLPLGYPGKLVIHVNDADSAITARNFALLVLLLKEGHKAVDAVIQSWYSTAVTSAQSTNITCTLTAVLGLSDNAEQLVHGKLLLPDGTAVPVTTEALLEGRTSGTVRFDLGHAAAAKAGEAAPLKAALLVDFPASTWRALLLMMANRRSLQEGMRSRADATRTQVELDKLDRHLLPMRPFNRVAWSEFYDQGMLLPFGALNAHHNTINRLLFNPEYGFTLGGGSDPLHGWPLPDVMAAGKRHQVPANDLYGALFFYLREQLSAFVDRCGRLDLEFRLTAGLAQELAPALQQQGVMLDYIDTSNIADDNYCGARRVLQDWGPLLNWRRNPDATLVTLFMNWIAAMPDLEPGAGMTRAEYEAKLREVVPTLLPEMEALRGDMAALGIAERIAEQPGSSAAIGSSSTQSSASNKKSGKKKKGGRRRASGSGDSAVAGSSSGGAAGRQQRPFPSSLAIREMGGMMEKACEAVKERHDYTATLQRYLERKVALSAAKVVGLHQRGAPHRIVPLRMHVPLGAPHSAPAFHGLGSEEAELLRCFAGAALTERYVEWMGGQ